MSDNYSPHQQAFDHYAADYDAALEQGLYVSGENKDYFARGRVAWMRRCLTQLEFKPDVVLDFGCATGTAIPFLCDLLGAARIIGVDVSAKSIEVARGKFVSVPAQFEVLNNFRPEAQFDAAYCNGVFHHIPLAERAGAVDSVFRALRAGGLLSFWENNPWNPGTRHVMNRIPFDRDAVTLSPLEGRRLLRAAGFEIVRSDFLFYFPRFLGWLRFLERGMVKLPLGAQYHLLARRPTD